MFPATPPPEPTIDPTPERSLPGIDEVEALIDGLELHREHPHTMPLHDALYGLLVQLREEPWGEAVERAMTQLAQAGELEHPMRAQLAALLGERPAPPPQRSLEAILAAEPGVPLRDDPLEALDLHLRQRRELVHLLEQRQEELVRNLQRKHRMLDISVGAATLLFLLGGLGWAIALDWFSVSDDQIVDEQRDDEDEPDAPEGRQGRSHRP